MRGKLQDSTGSDAHSATLAPAWELWQGEGELASSQVLGTSSAESQEHSVDGRTVRGIALIAES